MLTDTTVEGFLDVLGSAAPVPGGGGAAALAGAMAAALGEMVANLTSGKKKYAHVQGQIDELLPQLESLHSRMLGLIEEDARAFEPLSRAYGLPRSTPEEQARKAQVMEEALREACQPPLGMMQAALEVIDVLEVLAKIGTRIAISDVGVAASLAHAALQGASMSVFVNAAAMGDRAYAAQVNDRAQSMLDEGCCRAQAVFYEVERGIRWPKN